MKQNVRAATRFGRNNVQTATDAPQDGNRCSAEPATGLTDKTLGAASLKGP
jgi:hypothetical protein